MFNKKILILLPILLLYILLCVFLSSNSLHSDEWTYSRYANNLSHGFYADSDSHRLWCGPGYPLFLTPFAKLSVPWIVAKYFNALLVFGGVCFLFLTLRQYLSSNKSLIIAYLFALYPPMLIEIPKLLTESISVFFVTGFIYFLTLSFRTPKWRNYLLAGIFCSLIILTKVFYAYVVLGTLIISLLFCIRNKSFLKLAGIYLFAFVLCSPYLFYTKSITV
jgi:4-amino-4-deoxy-L-arabinose transferase-like glycosyltransferase